MKFTPPKFAVGSTAQTLYWTPGSGRNGQEGICAESQVRIAEVSHQRYGRGKGDWDMPRYRVEFGGMSLWIYEDALAS